MNVLINRYTGEHKNMLDLFGSSLNKMIRFWDWSILSAVLCASISFCFGSMVLFYALTGIIILDGITGMLASKKRKQPICSDVFRWKTFVKLIAYFAILLVAATVDLAVENLQIIDHSLVHALAIGWIVLVEGVSVIENSEVLLGHKFPPLRIIKRYLADVEEQTKGESDG